jgi:hypothetical protein
VVRDMGRAARLVLLTSLTLQAVAAEALAGGPEPIERLPGAIDEGYGAQLAVSPDGSALVAWIRAEGGGLV